MQNCADCSTSGPMFCDAGDSGYFMKNGQCVDCDSYSESVICKQCQDETVCEVCAQGYRLEDGECKLCELDKCADCNNLTGKCNLCKMGFYLDDQTGSCKPCTEPCKECSSANFCLTCDANVHQLVHPEDGNCSCDAYRGWYT